MRYKQFFFTFLIAAISCGFAGEIDFSRYPKRKCWAAGGVVTITPAFDALKLTWNPAERKFMEFTFPQAPLLGTFEKLTVTVKLKRSEKSTLNALALRLIDKDGEIFQFKKNVGPETTQLIYRINGLDPKPNGCWKSSAKAVANKKMDMPVSLLGMSVDYPANSGPGEVLVTSIRYEKFPEESEPVNAREAVPVPGEKFRTGTENDQRFFEYSEGIFFPVLRGGQFRLRVKAGAAPQAQLLLLHGKQEKAQKPATVKAGDDNVYTLIYPVPYELDGTSVSLKKIRIDSAGPVQMIDLTYEIPHVELAFNLGEGSDFNVWQQGVPGKVRFSNTRTAALSGKAELIWSDNAGKELERIIEHIELAPGESKEIALPEPQLYGLYHLSGTLPGKDGRPVVFRRRLGFMPPNNAEEHDGMQYGVALLTPALKRLEITARAARYCGADFDRSSIIWAYIERHQGKWDWSYPDAHYRILKDAKLRWAPILWFPPRWATSKTWKPSYEPVMQSFGFPLPDYDLWTTYVRNCVERYGRENIRVMEIWNEAELPGFANFTPEEYAELLKRAYDVIKSVNPKIQVSACGYTCMPGQHPRMTFPDFMPRSLKAARGKYDLHPIHYHGFFHEYVGGIGAFLEARKEWGVTAPWAANETAMTSSFCTRLAQAEILFEKMVYSQVKGAVAHVWHNMYDLGRDHFNKEHNFGLLDHALEPKEAYLAYNNVTRLFRGAGLVRDLTVGDCYMFLFKKGDTLLIPGWTLYPPASERLFELTGVTGKAEFIDVFGNRTPVRTEKGKLLLHVSSAPMTLALEQDTLPEIKGEVFTATRDFGEFKLASGSGVKSVTGAFADGSARELAVGGDGTFRYPVKPEKLRKPQALTLTFDTELGEFAVRKFLTPQFRLPANANFNRPADFSLQDASSYMQTSPNDPMYADCIYKGADDCSVRLWLGWKSPDKIAVRVVVRDDIHFQDQKGVQIYQGDGLQIFFSQTITGGMWKVGIAKDNDGEIRKFCWMKPGKGDGDALLEEIPVSIIRNETAKDTVYEMEFPAKRLGIVRGKPFRFNLLVNDNDGRCRVGYHSLTEIRGDGRNDIGYPVIVFEE